MATLNNTAVLLYIWEISKDSLLKHVLIFKFNDAQTELGTAERQGQVCHKTTYSKLQCINLFFIFCVTARNVFYHLFPRFAWTLNTIVFSCDFISSFWTSWDIFILLRFTKINLICCTILQAYPFLLHGHLMQHNESVADTLRWRLCQPQWYGSTILTNNPKCVAHLCNLSFPGVNVLEILKTCTLLTYYVMKISQSN